VNGQFVWVRWKAKPLFNDFNAQMAKSLEM